MTKKCFYPLAILTIISLLFVQCSQSNKITLSKSQLQDKIKGAWAGQTLGCTYGGPTEFHYCGMTMHDTLPIPWSDKEMEKWYNNAPGLYDDIYVDLTFVDVFEKYGLEAPVDSFASAFVRAGFPLCHANQMARYNLRRGMKAPACGHWKNNPHADCIDFQIEADFAGIMAPGMPNTASEICDKIGHIMSYGDGWYGGVYVAAMYSLAFVSNDINHIVTEALKTIPQQSLFYQCMNDVILWHKQYPTDWKQTWQELEKKWGSNDTWCPDGINWAFNIESKVNAAYIIMGLLYGQGDFRKTVDISTRCGQDSDCNPASSGGILGTMLGYSNLPDEFKSNLPAVEDRPFSHTHISLNKAYELSMKHATELITKHNGSVDNENISIAYQEPVPVRFEQSFEGIELAGTADINQSITTFDSLEFEGTGLVIKGAVKGEIDTSYVAEVEIILNGTPVETVHLPLFFDHRKHEIFYNYELPKAKYQVTCKWLNPVQGADVWLAGAVFYTEKKN